LKVSTALSETQIEESHEGKPKPEGLRAVQDRVAYAVYAAALAVSIALWFLAVRAPLDLDETGSYWQISAGISKIWSRQFLFPSCLAYSYILSLWSKLFGISEIVLRIPSIFAMLGAVYLLYRNARAMFGCNSALVAAVIFSLHPTILFASIDIRPYAFAALAINAAIFILIRLRHNSSNRLAALFGLSAAWIVWFQYLFALILPFLALCFFAFKAGDRKTAWRQFSVSLAVFILALLPTVPGLLFLFRTRATHVFETAPNLYGLVRAFAPGWLLPILICLAPVSMLISTFSTWRRDSNSHVAKWQILLCVSLGVIPVLILYGVSVGTPINVFVSRYALVAVPGIALCWALILSYFRPPAVRPLFCIALATLSGFTSIKSPTSRQHEVPFKYVIGAVEANASADNAPVLICSNYIESDYAVMPLESAKTSYLFAPLTYYPLSVPVVPLPRDLNKETMRVGSLFLQQAEQKHERFLAVGHVISYETLAWLEQRASSAYTIRELEVVDGFKILEFLPR
jgi:mannosyltransferase